jgi:hypothetical protein
LIIKASDANPLTFMEMRHHAGAKVGVLVIDEQQDFSADPERQSKQKSVPRTAAILGCPVWFAEIGGKEASDTHEPLIRAAGFRSCEAAQQAGTVLKKRNKTNAFEGSNLGARLTSVGIEFLVILGQYAGCCVYYTILGTPPKPPRPEGAAPMTVTSKPLPKPPGGTGTKVSVPAKLLPVPPLQGPGKPLPTPHNYDAIRRKPLPTPPPKESNVATVRKLDAVSYCFVLTSESLANGKLPSSVTSHPKCLVFEAVGTKMWPETFSQGMADQSRGAAV